MDLHLHLYDLQAGIQTIRFSLSAPQKLQGRNGEPFAGVMPLFFQAYLVGEPEQPNIGPHAPSMIPSLPQAPVASPPLPKLGEPYVPPPAGMLLKPSPLFPVPSYPLVAPKPQVFRAISDIRAVLVESA